MEYCWEDLCVGAIEPEVFDFHLVPIENSLVAGASLHALSWVDDTALVTALFTVRVLISVPMKGNKLITSVARASSLYFSASVRKYRTGTHYYLMIFSTVNRYLA